MAEEWYCSWDEGIRGPFTDDEFRQLARRGKINEADQVRRGKTGTWEVAAVVAAHLFPGYVPPKPLAVPLPPQAPPPPPVDPEPKSKYPALRAVAGWYQLLAVLTAVMTAVVVLGLIVTTRSGEQAAGSVIAAAAVFVAGAVSAVTLYAVKEAIQLAIDVEHTLRQIRDRSTR